MYLWGAESNQTWYIKWQNQSEKMRRKYHHHMLVNLWFSFLKSHFLLINLKLAHQFHQMKITKIPLHLGSVAFNQQITLPYSAFI